MLACLVLIGCSLEQTSEKKEWTFVDESESAGIYIDLDTIERTGNTIRVQKLFEFSEKQDFEGNFYMSAVTYDEYDCENGKLRILQGILYSGNTGLGNNVRFTTAASDWRDIPPETTASTVRDIVCRLKKG